MAVHEEDVQTLTLLGLTALQAKVYLELLRLKKATGKTLSQHSKVARQETYRLLAELQGKGLVEKIICVPTEFRPVPIEDCLNILIEHKKSEIAESQKKAHELIKNLKRNNSRTLQEEEPHFVLIPQEGSYLRKLKKEFENCQKSIETITTLKRFRSITSIFNEEIKKALKRGVKMRMITEKPEDESPLPEMIEALMQNPLYRVRYLPNPPRAPLLIIDKKEVTIVTSHSSELDESPTLWSNSPSLVAVFSGYFETAWLTAMEHPSNLSLTRINKTPKNFL